MGDLDLSELAVAPGSFDPEACGEFYRRHERGIAGFLMHRTGSAELTADLALELSLSEQVVRKRVSRGLRRPRELIGG
jgi:hypothetical protein